MTASPHLLPQPPLPWLLAPWQQLAQASQAARLAQGILITGLEGIGVADFARAFAQFLLCEAPRDYVSCGVCRGCQLLLSGNHPDIFHLRPEDQSSVIKVQQIRELGEFMANTAQQGGRKVIVVEPAEAMNTNAANALLKNLEEPIGQTYFLLASCYPSRLLATIKSRCNRILLDSPSRTEACAWLERNQVKQAEVMLAQANGAPLKVVEWLASNYFENSRQLSEQLLLAAQGQGGFNAIAKAILALGVPHLLERLIFWCQRAASKQMDSTLELQLPFEQQLVQRASPLLHQFYESLLRKRALQLSGNNLNGQLVVEEVLIELAALFKA